MFRVAVTLAVPRLLMPSLISSCMCRYVPSSYFTNRHSACYDRVMSALPRTHLLDPTFDRIDRTYCGMAGPALTSPTTTDPAEATCKACLEWRRKLDRERAA